jgi:four helix bundle protein
MSVHRFAHHRLDCFHVAKQALVLGHEIVRSLPRGYSVFGDQLQRALQGTYHQLCEGVAREGADRKQRLRIARAECCEAAGAVEGIEALKLVDGAKAQELLALLDRVAAMLTGLAGLRRK